MERGTCGLIVGGAAFVLLVIGILLSFYTVGAGEVGSITNWGAVQYTVNPGLGMKVPIANGIVKMNIQTQKDEVDASSASKDLQTVTAKIAVNYRLDPAFAMQVYQEIGTDYQNKIVSPAIQNAFKSVTAQYTAEELITKREEVRIKAEKALSEQVTKYHVIIENFNVVNFDFSKAFNDAIEAKQVAQQEVETAKQKLAQAQVDAETAIAQAKGQAESQKALKDTGAMTPEYLYYIFLQKWDGKLPAVMGGASPMIDVNSMIPASGK